MPTPANLQNDLHKSLNWLNLPNSFLEAILKRGSFGLLKSHIYVRMFERITFMSYRDFVRI